MALQELESFLAKVEQSAELQEKISKDIMNVNENIFLIIACKYKELSNEFFVTEF